MSGIVFVLSDSFLVHLLDVCLKAFHGYNSQVSFVCNPVFSFSQLCTSLIPAGLFHKGRTTGRRSYTAIQDILNT